MSEDLKHFGVKGMKWGVRRHQPYQKGSRNAGKFIDSSKSKDEKDKKGLTDRQKKYIATGVTTVALGLAAYGAYRIDNSRELDRVVKRGKEFYRQGHADEKIKGLNELTYASFKKRDMKMYKTNSVLKDKVSYTLTNPKDVRIAGTRNAKKIYEELLKTDPDFAKNYSHMKYEDFNGSLGQANGFLVGSSLKLKDTYIAPFIDEIASRGYDAIVDTQDGFAKVPVILLPKISEYRISGSGE